MRDTEEARKLAEVADQAIMGEDQTFSANNLWGIVVNFLTVTPGRQNHALYKSDDSANSVTETNENGRVERHRSRLSRLWHGNQSASKERLDIR